MRTPLFLARKAPPKDHHWFQVTDENENIVLDFLPSALVAGTLAAAMMRPKSGK